MDRIVLRLLHLLIVVRLAGGGRRIEHLWLLNDLLTVHRVHRCNGIVLALDGDRGPADRTGRMGRGDLLI